MRFLQHAIAVLPALLVMVTPAIAQPKSSPVPQTSPALNSQQQQELQQLRAIAAYDKALELKPNFVELGTTRIAVMGCKEKLNWLAP